jgi:type IV secretory pathway VirB10-like protein
MDDTTKRNVYVPVISGSRSGDSLPSGRRASEAPAIEGSGSGGTGERTAPSQLTYATKLPPDHPGLQLEIHKGRTLRRGPILTGVAVVATATSLALVVAFTPSKDGPKAAQATPSAEPSSADVALPDAIKNPTAESRTEAPPSLDQPRPAQEARPAGRRRARQFDVSPSAPPGSDEHSRILSSPILADVDNPTPIDATVHPGGPIGSLPTLATAAAAAGTVAGTQGALAAGPADPNLQQHKNDFLNRDGVNNATYVSQPLVLPRSPYEIKAGTIIPTSLITGINSDLPGQIVGQVRENVYDTVTGNYLLIPQGSRLLASYDSAVTFGQSRVLVCWNRLIRPDGVSVGLECMPGVDLSGYAGFADDVDHHWFRIITGVALGTLLSATAQRSQGDVTGYTPTVPQLWAANAGSSLNQAGQAITQKNLSIQPTITVRPGYSVNVLVSKDIVLVPYDRTAR